MSTSAPQATQTDYVEFDEYIDYQLAKTRNQIKLLDIFTAAAGVAVIVLAYLFAFTLLDHWVIPGGFSTTARAVMLGLLLVGSLSWVAWKIAVPYFRSVNRLFAAKAIEDAEPALKGNLLSLVDLAAANREVPESIRRAIEKRAAVGLTHTDVDHAVDRNNLMRLCIALMIVVVACSLYAAMSPKSLSFMRPLSTVDVAVATRTLIVDVRPGDTEVLAGSHLTVSVDVSGDKPDFVRAFFTTDDKQFVDHPVELRQSQDGAAYEGNILGDRNRGIVRDLTYYVQAGDAESDAFKVSVLQPPTVTVERVEYRYPKYMAFEDETRGTGNIENWEGVEVVVTAKANMPLKSARVRCSDGEDLSQRAEEYRVEFLDSDQTKLQASWKLAFRSDESFPRRYRFDCSNERGQSDPEPTLYSISIHPDEQPRIRIDAPIEDMLEQPANGVIPLIISAEDDFKVRWVGLRISHGDELDKLIEEEVVTGSAIFDGENAEPKSKLGLNYDFRLNDRFKPGTEIEFWVEARDNRDFPEEGQRGASRRKIKVKIIEPKPPEEVKRDLEQKKQEQQDRKDNQQQQNPDQNKDPNQQAQPDKNDNAQPQDNKQPNKQEGDPKDQKQEPGDGEQQSSDGGTGGKNGKPQQSQGGTGENKPSDPNQKPNDPNQQPQDPKNQDQGSEGNQDQGSGGSQSNRPAENDEALKDLFDKFKNQSDQNKNDQPNKSQPEQPSDPNSGDPKQPNDQNPDSKPNPGSEQKPDDNQQKKPDGTENPKDSSPDAKSPNETGDQSPKPDNKQPTKPDSGNPESQPNQKPNDGTQNTGEKSDKPDGAKPDQGNEPKDQGSNKPDEGSKDTGAGGGESKTGGGDKTQPGGGNNPSDQKPEPSDDTSGGGGQGKSPTDKPGEETKDPLSGTEKPTDPNEGGTPNKSEGDETGTAKSSDDQNKDVPKAKNPDQIKRQDGDESKATRRPGDGSNQPPNDRNGTGEKPDNAKPNTDNTQDLDNKNPDENPSTAEGTDKKKPADAKREGDPNTPNEDLKNRNDPKRSPQSSGGGEEGSGKTDDVGARGSKDKGPGDNTKDPGNREPSPEKTGNPGEKPGEGSATNPTEKTENATDPNGKPNKPDDPQGATGESNGTERKPSDDPNGTPGGSKDGPKGDRDPDAKPARDDSGTFDENRKPNADDSQPPRPPKTDGKQANEDFNRQAAEFVLRKLEDQIERGEVDEKMLKDLGWDKGRMNDYVKWLRDGLHSHKDAGPAPTSARHFDQVLENLDLNAPTRVRSGQTEIKRNLDGVGSGRSKVPARYSRSFKKYSRSLAEDR